MLKTTQLVLQHPEPPTHSMRVVPFFLPLSGCPGRCIFCDQHAQTGQESRDLETALAALGEMLKVLNAPFELGFFGGTFTGLDRKWQTRFLEVADHFRHSGELAALRISTRPDRVNADSLTWLREQGVDLVELGVQSFTSSVLAMCGRGYSEGEATAGCVHVRAAGLKLGIQLLPGLPGHSPMQWRKDVQHTLSLCPDVVRIYPCVVLAETELARWHARGAFLPWSLEQAVEETAWAVRQFWEQGIRVIRLGLAGEPAMLKRLVAGPWHPAFGNMVRSRVLLELLTERLVPQDRVHHLRIPVRLSGELWGHRGAHKFILAQWGIAPHMVSLAQSTEIIIELERLYATHTCH